MRAVKIVLAVTGLLLLVAILWSTYLLHSIDENKGLLEQRFSSDLGREVRIEQGVSARFSLTPSITLEGLRIGNPDWAQGEYLVRAERAHMQIDLLALLGRRLVFEELTIQGADVLLETAEDGRTNWSFGTDDSGIEVRLDAVEIEDSKVSHRSPDGDVLRANIPEIRVAGLGSDELQLKARFSYRDVPVSASLTSSQQADARAGERPFRGEVEMPGTTLKVLGVLKGLFELVDLEVHLQSDRLDLQKSVLGLWTPVALTGSTQQVDGRFRTSGDSKETLIANLGGELRIGAATFQVPGKTGGEARDLALNELRLVVEPEQPVRLSTGLVYEQQPYRVELEGGLLADLFGAKESWNSLRVRSTGQARGKPFEVAGDIGPMSAIQAGSDLNVKLQAKHDELVIGVDGKLASLTALPGSRFSLDIKGPSLSRLTPWLHVDLPDTPRFRFSGRVAAGEHQLDITGLKLVAGKSDVSGDLSLPLAGGKAFRGALVSDSLDLQPLLRRADTPKNDVPADTGSVLDRELPTGMFGELEGTLDFKIRRSRLFEAELEALDLDARLHRDHLELVARAEGGRVVIDADLRRTGHEWQVALRHTADVELGELIDRSRHPEDRSKSPVHIDATLKGSGKSLKQIIGSMQGTYTMVLGKGRLSENVSGRLPFGGVLYSVLSAVDPLSDSREQTELECAVIHLEVSEGVATSTRGLAMRTREMNLLGGGALKLATGEIDGEFKTAPRKGLGLSVVGVADRFVRITGTLWEPKVGVNVKSAITHGTAAWATGGLSLLFDSAFRRLTASSNPCEAVQKRIDKKTDP